MVWHAFPVSDTSTAQDALKIAIREQLGPALRSEGYRGSGTTWTRQSPRGDFAVVNVQSSSFSSRSEVTCVINLAVAPQPWLAWHAVQLGKPVPKSPKEYDGLWRDRLHATDEVKSRGGEAWWSVRDDSSAQKAVENMVGGLTMTALPRLSELLDREGLIRSVRQGDLGHIKAASARGFFDRALGLLLADDGPSDELALLLDRFADEPDERLIAYDRKFLPWLTERIQGNAGR